MESLVARCLLREKYFKRWLIIDLDNFFPENLKQVLRRDKSILALSLAFFVFTFAMSFYYPYLVDSVTHIERASFILENLRFPLNDFSFDDPRTFVYPPVFHLLLAGSKAIFGTFKIVSPFMGAISVFMTYKLVSLWYEDRIALLSAISLALTPFFIVFSARAYVGTTVTAGFLLTFYFYFKYLETNVRKYLYFSFAVGGFVTAVKTYGPFALVLVGFHYLWINLEDFKASFFNLVGPGLLAAFISAPWPLRNIFLVGNPFPKVFGRTYGEVSSAAGSGLSIFSEFGWFLRQLSGIDRVRVVMRLKMINPILGYLWYLVPASLFGLLAYGSLEERDNHFVWFWIIGLVVLYGVGRVVSGGGWQLKTRHFITLAPVSALFMARSYQRMPVKENIKRILYGLIALGLMVQMLAGVITYTHVSNVSWNPVVEYTEDNIPEDDVIYSPRSGNEISYLAEKDYKIITSSDKPGYIHPGGDFISQLSEKADWVIVQESNLFPDRRLRDAERRKIIKLEKNVDAQNKLLGFVYGKKWNIYRVNSSDG